MTKRSVNFMAYRAAVLRLRRRVVGGCDLLLTTTAAPLRSLNTPGGHDLFARLDARDDRDLVAARGAELHELLAHAAVRLAVLALHVSTMKTESPYGA